MTATYDELFRSILLLFADYNGGDVAWQPAGQAFLYALFDDRVATDATAK
jgi:hypothetical protein